MSGRLGPSCSAFGSVGGPIGVGFRGGGPVGVQLISSKGSLGILWRSMGSETMKGTVKFPFMWGQVQGWLLVQSF